MNEQTVSPGEDSSAHTADGAHGGPVLRVVSGNPSAEEIAALIAVVSALGGGEDGTDSESPAAQWSAPARLHRGPVNPGPAGSWWASGLPH